MELNVMVGICDVSLGRLAFTSPKNMCIFIVYYIRKCINLFFDSQKKFHWIIIIIICTWAQVVEIP